jgi:hypothetical protein
MTVSKGSGNLQRDLNHMTPAAANARLGDRVNDLITNLNLLTAQFNAALALLVAANGASVPLLTTVTALKAAVAIPTLATLAAPELPGDRP